MLERRRNRALHVIAQAMLELLANVLEDPLDLVDRDALLHAYGVHLVMLTGMDALLADELQRGLAHFRVAQFIELTPC